MRRARIVRIEWDREDALADLLNASISNALLRYFDYGVRFTVSGEPSFTVEKRSNPMPDALFGPKSFTVKESGE